MDGYCETGNVLIDRMPASITMMAMTQAKIGRLMKKRGIGGLFSRWGRGFRCGSGGLCHEWQGFDGGAWAGHLESFQDHPIAHFQAIGH